MTEPIRHGKTGFVLRSRLPTFDIARGKIITETWGGLYSEMQTKYDELIAAGATSVVPSLGGAVVTLTAIFGGNIGSEGGGGGGGGGVDQPLTEQWATDPQIFELELSRILTWGCEGDPLSTENKTRAQRIVLANSMIAQGRLDEYLAMTFATNNYQYASIKSSGVTGAMRCNYAVTKTTTWADRSKAKAYVPYANVWKVIEWADVNAPVNVEEPIIGEINTAGAWERTKMYWLVMPPRTSWAKPVWQVTEQWLGARKWIGALYENGTG